MKLRNKKTGEITRDDDWDFVGLVLKVNHADDTIEMDDRIEYHSLAELNEEWEDYTPSEPLIKDPKVRKAVRAWADANDIEQVQYLYDGNILWFGDNEIGFKYLEPLTLELNEYYTIKELCGEEE